MGSFFGWLGGIFSSLGSAGASLLKTAAVLALDVGAALLGGKTVVGEKLKNKTIASSTYGHPIPRCRGTVRVNGQLIWWNGIQETTHKNTSGGIFGIGQTSVYTYTYSASVAFAFGKKLGGGAAVRFIRLWADGKLLYNTVGPNSSLTGTVSIVGTPAADSQVIPISVSGGGSITLAAGDLIELGTFVSGTFVATDPNTQYEVQQDVTLASGQTGNVSIYPPISGDVTGAVVYLPGAGSPILDQSSFDPNPHDGSHVVGNPVPNGSIRFHYGSDTEQPDPALVKQFGANAPAYRGLTYVMLDFLELANYGNHIPSISAEIAFDTATGQFPSLGPVPNVTLLPGGGGPTKVLLPTPQASSLSFFNPINTLPYVWAISGVLPNITIYKVDTQSNTLLASKALGGGDGIGGLMSPAVVDPEGFIYFVSGGWALFKFNGQAMAMENSYGISIMANVLQVWDLQASAFGSPAIIKLLASIGSFGGIQFWDRTVLRPIGISNPASTTEVVIYYATDGTPVLTLGDPTYIGADTGPMVADAKGYLWLVSGANLTRYDTVPTSGIYVPALPNIVPCLLPPTFNQTVIDVSAITVGSGHIALLFYYPGDNSIIVLGDNGLTKISADTFEVLASNTTTPPWGGGLQDGLGFVVDAIGTFTVTNAISSVVWRYDANSLELLNTYNLSSWGGINTAIYDGPTNSLWGRTTSGGGLIRIFLDRGNGDGLGLDVIVGAIFAEAGYDPAEYNVTALAAISTQGYEIDQESYDDSIKKLQSLFLFDRAEIDGKVACVPRSAGPGSFTILEDDLGATDIGTAPAPRVSEVLQQETDVPQTVWVQYYDSTKELQQATQYAKRIAQPYDSALAANPKVTNSRNQLNVSVPVTDSPPRMKQAAQNILLDAWQSRMRYSWKTGIKWVRIDPTDKGTLTYKGENFDVRVAESDLGAQFAREFQGASYDSGVYSVPAQSGGGGGSPLTGSSGGNVGKDTYTLSPPCPLSQTSTTNLALSAEVATFDDGSSLFYNARPTLAIPDPGAGLTQIYYVSIHDPLFAGEAPGTASLSVLVETTPDAAHVGELGYIYMGSFLAAGSGATGVELTCGGIPPNINTIIGAVIVEVPAGTVDGSNKAFTLSQLPNPLASLQLYLNGVQQIFGVDYSISSKTVTFVNAPSVGDRVLAFYRLDGFAGHDSETPSGAINGSNAGFTLAFSPSPAASLLLYLNGTELIAGSDYTLSGASITMTTAPSSGDSLLAFYRSDGSTLQIADSETPSGTINGTNKAFTLAHAAVAGTLMLFLNGDALTVGVDFTYSGTAITFVNAPSTGDSLKAFYRF